MKIDSFYQRLLLSLPLLLLLACNLLAPRPIPTPMPPTPAITPIPISQQVMLIMQSWQETNQTPPFRISYQTPQLAGSDDPRVTAFNGRLHNLVAAEVDTYRQSFLQITAPNVGSGSFLEATHTLVSQIGDVWSFKFDFHFYSDGAAHPGLNSMTLNYDLAQGRELTLADLFLPGSNYLEAVAGYCIAELSRQPGFDGPWAEGAKPTPENYRQWNITPEGLLVTFAMYQVAPGASSPQQVLVPWTELEEMLSRDEVLKVIVP